MLTKVEGMRGMQSTNKSGGQLQSLCHRSLRLKERILALFNNLFSLFFSADLSHAPAIENERRGGKKPGQVTPAMQK